MINDRERKKRKNEQDYRIFQDALGSLVGYHKSLWVILKDDMKKEAQTYKEEREEQKRRVK